MDEIFHHFQKMFDDTTFSGFFRPKLKDQSPRDEMLRIPEDEFGYLQSLNPHPWMSFDFFRDMVSPDMDRNIPDGLLGQKNIQELEKKDIIIDDQPSYAQYIEERNPSIQSWTSYFSSKRVFGSDGKIKELQRRVVREPDGTEVHTTIEKSPDGEKKHVIYKRPDGQHLSITNSDVRKVWELSALRSNTRSHVGVDKYVHQAYEVDSG
ncbi:unnamed protein product [Heterobilharzia americana]|nr:unnamed protein product [Heterobilharzia americana]